MLEQSQIAHYLLSLGLVKPRAIVEEDLTIVDASRRNCVFIASTAAGPTHVVKQGPPHSAPTLAHEAEVLRALAHVPALCGVVPAVVRYDAQAACLVLRSPVGARDWAEHHRSGRYPRTRAHVLGRALAALHSIPADAVDDRPQGAEPMWGLTLPEPPYEAVLDMSAGAWDLLARVQGSERLSGRLRHLRGRVGDGALVHGDLRWDNCLVVARQGSARQSGLLLIDWELAGRGAPASDVGTVIAEYLQSWVASIPIVAPTDPGRLISHAAHPLWRMRPAIDALWTAYRQRSEQPPTLTEVVELAAVRLLQAAVEQAEGLDRPTAHVITLVQLANNMLEEPNDAAIGLLGLTA
jgi:aminoglycoside phosphotransferase (APT) family kinase protein